MILPSETAAAPSQLDLALIRKYSIPAPRYTSYPPATRFTEDLASLDLDEAIAADNRPGAGPVSLYFHLPFCQTLCWYCGCNMLVARSRTDVDEYLNDLEREVELTTARMNVLRPVTQVHLGGGTPNFLSPFQLARLGLIIHNHFFVTPDCEFGVELDPRRLTAEQVEALHVIGATRASIGVQDTDPAVQLAIHRWQPQDLNRQAVTWLRQSGFSSINVDLIYGLPLQTPESFGRTIDDVLALEPDRLSVFSYAHVPWARPSQTIFDTRQQLPGAEDKLAMFAIAHSRLTAAGYIDIGLDHFARPDDELAIAQRRGTLHRNFQGYSTAAGASLYGFGLSSISSTADSYRQNHKRLESWQTAVRAGQLPVARGLRLDREDQLRRSAIMRLMCDGRLDYATLSRQLEIDFAQHFAAEIASLNELEADGIIQSDRAGLQVTPRGRPLLRIVAMHFDTGFSATPGRHAQAV